MGNCGKARGQSRLADTRVSDQDHDSGSSVAHRGKLSAQLPQLGVASDEERTDASQQWWQRHLGQRVLFRLGPQHLEVDGVGLRGGIDPQLLREQHSAALVGLEGTRPVPRPGEDAHEPLVSDLPKGVKLHRSLGRHEGALGVATCQRCLGGRVERPHEQFALLGSGLLNPPSTLPW
jgi:hypothetical protein